MFLKRLCTYKTILVVIVLTAVSSQILTGGCTQKSAQISSLDPPKDPPGPVEKGRQLFDERGCMGCHSVNGKGGHVGPDLSNEANAGHSRQWLTTQIRDPKKNDPQTFMPAFDTLSDSQVSDLVSYLLSLSTSESKKSEKQSVETGKTMAESSEPSSFSMEEAGQLWSQKCGLCHNLRSPDEYSDAQWQVAVFHMRIRVPLTGQEQKEILAFLQASN